jgi:hypothetical protein
MMDCKEGEVWWQSPSGKKRWRGGRARESVKDGGWRGWEEEEWGS